MSSDAKSVLGTRFELAAGVPFIIIIQVFVNCKILSIETILSEHTHTHTDTEAPAHTSILTIQR